MSVEQLPLFVYGTLRAGEYNHEYLAGRYARILSARLPDFDRVHPMMIVPHAGASVEGELYFLTPATYEGTLSACDALELIPPGETAGKYYRRGKVRVETAEGFITAWAYVHPSAEEL